MSLFDHTHVRLAAVAVATLLAMGIIWISMREPSSSGASSAATRAAQGVTAPPRELGAPPAAAQRATTTRSNSPSSPRRDTRPAALRRADVFAGNGAWIDIFDDWTRPAEFTRNLANKGVHTLYVQTSNSSQPYTIYRPELMGRMLEEAHDRGIRVVAWYLPELRILSQDIERSIAATKFRSPRGDQFDGFAMDIESQAVPNITTRVKRLVRLSYRVRGAIGADYPFAAIVPPPSKGTDNPRAGWTTFPWKQLAPVYDAWMPMSFFVLADPGTPATRAERVRNNFVADVQHIRRRTQGAPQRPVHIIAETAAEAGRSELRGFTAAVKATKATGASVYDAQTSSRADWRAVRSLRLAPQQPADAAPAWNESAPSAR
jgi:hypothetical protein